MARRSRSEIIRQAIDRHIGRLASLLLLAAVSLTVVGAFIQPVQDFMMQKRVFEVLILALLLDVVTRLAEIRQKSTIEFYVDQAALMPELLSRIRQKRPKKAKLLENSSVSIRDLISCLTSVEAEVQILLHDPFRNCVNTIQRNVTVAQIETIANGALGPTDRVEIRFYSAPAAVRGRRIGDLINLGWYSYFHRANGTVDLFGSQNPMILAEAQDVPELAAYFDATFERLWPHALSVAEMLEYSSREAKSLKARLDVSP